MIVYLGVGEGAHPQVPVEVLGHRHLGQIERFGWFTHAAIYLLDVSQSACTYQCNGLLELGTAALLASHLQYAVVGSYGSLHGQAFCDGVGLRLLQIHILACLHRVDGYQCVPMVGCGYLDGIYILALEQSLILLIHVAALWHSFALLPASHVAAEALALDAIHIAACCHLHTGATGE